MSLSMQTNMSSRTGEDEDNFPTLRISIGEWEISTRILHVEDVMLLCAWLAHTIRYLRTMPFLFFFLYSLSQRV